jgi:hypothetical protein
MWSKKTIVISAIVFLAVVVYEISSSTKVKVDDGVRPYLERFLDLMIEKDYEVIYDKYLRERSLPFDDFCTRMGCFSTIFGAEIESFSYERSYVGGVGYFFVYRLVLSDEGSYSCFFSFPAKPESTICVEDLQGMSISANFGEKGFQVSFGSGNVSSYKSPEGLCGEN